MGACRKLTIGSIIAGMSTSNPLQAAVDQVGLTAIAQACGVTYQAVRKWLAKGRMPRTEWTGETAYAKAIAALCGGPVTPAALLAPWPAPPNECPAKLPTTTTQEPSHAG